MERSVSARLVFRTVADTKVALAISVARNPGYTSFDESLSVTAEGAGSCGIVGPSWGPHPLYGVP